jgi:high-affinity Fe2+/Pb2+ permease
MQFLQDNAGNIIVGLVVAAALGFVVFRVLKKIRGPKGGCGCGCGE